MAYFLAQNHLNNREKKKKTPRKKKKAEAQGVWGSAKPGLSAKRGWIWL